CLCNPRCAGLVVACQRTASRPLHMGSDVWVCLGHRFRGTLLMVMLLHQLVLMGGLFVLCCSGRLRPDDAVPEADQGDHGRPARKGKKRSSSSHWNSHRVTLANVHSCSSCRCLKQAPSSSIKRKEMLCVDREAKPGTQVFLAERTHNSTTEPG